MNYEESVRSTLSLLRRATETMLNERTILVDSVLHVRPRTDVAKLLAQVNPDGRKPSDSTVRRMITRTTLKMGLEELREKEGRRSFETRDKYKGEQCSRWIATNGGMPRLEQLADPSWDLQPYPPTDPSVGPTSNSETLAAKTMTSSKPTASNDKKSPLPEPLEPPLSLNKPSRHQPSVKTRKVIPAWKTGKHRSIAALRKFKRKSGRFQRQTKKFGKKQCFN